MPPRTRQRPMARQRCRSSQRPLPLRSPDEPATPCRCPGTSSVRTRGGRCSRQRELRHNRVGRARQPKTEYREWGRGDATGGDRWQKALHIQPRPDDGEPLSPLLIGRHDLRQQSSERRRVVVVSDVALLMHDDVRHQSSRRHDDSPVESQLAVAHAHAAPTSSQKADTPK